MVATARNVQRFDKINRDDIKEMILNYDQELPLEELEESLGPSNEKKQSKQDTEEEKPVKPDFLLK